jgi:hypothetical protein
LKWSEENFLNEEEEKADKNSTYKKDVCDYQMTTEKRKYYCCFNISNECYLIHVNISKVDFNVDLIS